jgi:hypothetical protein
VDRTGSGSCPLADFGTITVNFGLCYCALKSVGTFKNNDDAN